MKINSVYTNPCQTSSKTFGSYLREVKNKRLFSNNISHRNDTSFFRDRSLWLKLAELLEKRFKNSEKVNVYSYGCSEGSEAFSFVMLMLSKLGNGAKKYFPVIAKDFDPFIINKAKSKEFYFVTNAEKESINNFTNNSYNRFFKEIEPKFAFVSDELYNNVDFSVANINKDYKTIKPNNSVVFIRKFLPYLENDASREKLLNNISNQLSSGSLIVIGKFDRIGTNYAIDEMLVNSGFKATSVDYVYEKIGSKVD